MTPAPRPGDDLTGTGSVGPATGHEPDDAVIELGHGIEVDRLDSVVSWRPPPGVLLMRGAVFLLAGVALPLTVFELRGGQISLWMLALAVVMTVGSAAWLVAALRAGWRLDHDGISLGLGSRHPERVPWNTVATLEIVDPGRHRDLVIHRHDGRVSSVHGRHGPRAAAPGDAVAAARTLGVIPHTVETPDLMTRERG